MKHVILQQKRSNLQTVGSGDGFVCVRVVFHCVSLLQLRGIKHQVTKCWDKRHCSVILGHCGTGNRSGVMATISPQVNNKKSSFSTWNFGFNRKNSGDFIVIFSFFVSLDFLFHSMSFRHRQTPQTCSYLCYTHTNKTYWTELRCLAQRLQNDAKSYFYSATFQR